MWEWHAEFVKGHVQKVTLVINPIAFFVETIFYLKLIKICLEMISTHC